ncbi:uncharacterized protein OCT59_013808 [Rhizophagus irregularis]|uniref:uncharacterized protein n=1 Tax=Rhizophagus irregularis TaxID=588596 RepID=UPI003331296C|nr:hypothetical protein OCT59_013808 [Rhizophagus irregularis]
MFKCKQTQIFNPVQPLNPNISSPQSLTPNPPFPVIHIREKEGSKKGQATHLSIEDLATWLANSEIKNNPTIINKKVIKTDAEWFDLIERQAERKPSNKAYRKGQRKKVTPAPEIINQKDGFKDDSKDLDKKVPWSVPFSDKEWHREMWQKGIQMAKDMFKVDDAEYTFLTWFAGILKKDFINILLTAKSKKEVAKKAKEVYLQWSLCNEKVISEKIESLIQKYKAKDKGSPVLTGRH